VPVIASGDLFTAEDATSMLAETGCDALMVARGGYGNPWLIRQTLDRLDGRPERQPSAEERLAVAGEHLELFCDTFGPARTLVHMRKHLCWYTHGLPNAAAFRQRINRTGSVTEMFHLLTDFEAAAA
jgi:tRNA-dihydrouridine synthase